MHIQGHMKHFKSLKLLRPMVKDMHLRENTLFDLDPTVKGIKVTGNVAQNPRHHVTYAPEYGPRSAVGNVSGNRCESDCRSKGREFDPGPVPYFRGD